MSIVFLFPGLIVFFFAISLFYFKVADKFNIVDKPNERSSHTVVTLRGGGVLFPLAILTFFISSGFSDFPFLVLAVMLVSIVSFWDDIQSLPRSVRILAQGAAMSSLFYELQLFDLALWIVLISLVVAVGLINAYNFMDGINGITVMNSIVCTITLLFLVDESHMTVLIYLLPALLVFGYFNIRKKARCFAGDIGSVSVGYIISYFMFLLFLIDYDIQFLLILAVYGVDSILTIIQRLSGRENIFEPHRKHLYQYLVHTKRWSHLKTSITFTLIQVCVSALLVCNVKFKLLLGYQLTIGVLLILILLYVLVKRPLIRSNLEK